MSELRRALVAHLRALTDCVDGATPEGCASALAAGARGGLGEALAISAILFTETDAVCASDPPNMGFALRDGSVEVQRLFQHALGRFAVPGAFFVPRSKARPLAGVAAATIATDLLFVPLVNRDLTLGMLALTCEGKPPEDEIAVLRAYADAGARLLAARNAVSESQRESRDSRVLALVDERMRRSLDRRDILFAIADAVREGFGATRCAIVERSVAEGDRVAVLAVADDGTTGKSLPPWLPLAPQLRRVFAGATLRDDDDERLGLAEWFGVRELIAVPLIREGRVEQALTIGFSGNHKIDEGDVNALRAVGVHVGLALANARLYERERGRRARAESLEHVVRILRDTQSLEEVLLVFVIAVSHELPLDCAAYSLEEGALVRRALRTRVPGAEGPAGHVDYGSLEPYLSVDDPSDAMLLPREVRVELFRGRPGVIIPLRVDGALWGMLTVTIDPVLAEWAPDERATFFRTLGSHLELAIANANAFDREQRRAQERATLAEAARTILSHTTIERLADVMCRLAADLVQAQKACAIRVDPEGYTVLGAFGEVEGMVERVEAARVHRESRGTISNERRLIRVEEGPGYATIPLARAGADAPDQEIIDAFLVVRRVNEERFSRDDLRLLLELGALFALALRNLELYERTDRANMALRESSEFKDDLIAMLAHDFKGPLTVIHGYCELLLENVKEGHEEIETIFAQTQRLVRLSEDALVLAHTQAEGFSLDRATVNFGGFVAESVDSIARATGRVKMDISDEELLVSLDPQRFRHVIDNLISNGLKYSQGDITVSVRGDGNGALLEVVDHGIGIPADELTTLFTRFGRASNARRQGIAGSGVGLYVSRKIVEVHKGVISVRSQEHEGSVFSVRLPLTAAEMQRATPVASQAG